MNPFCEHDLGQTPKPTAAIDTVDFDLRCVCAIPAGDPLAEHDTVQAHRPPSALANEFVLHLEAALNRVNNQF